MAAGIDPAAASTKIDAVGGMAEPCRGVPARTELPNRLGSGPSRSNSVGSAGDDANSVAGAVLGKLAAVDTAGAGVVTAAASVSDAGMSTAGGKV